MNTITPATWLVVHRDPSPSGGSAPPPAEGYQPPSDWLEIPEPDTQEVIGIVMVPPGDGHCSVQCQGAYTVNWGDGTTTDYASNAVASHRFKYDDLPSLLGHKSVENIEGDRVSYKAEDDNEEAGAMTWDESTRTRGKYTGW